MRVSELTDLKQINALVALAQGWELFRYDNFGFIMWRTKNGHAWHEDHYQPASGNAQTYELIEKFGISVTHNKHKEHPDWLAHIYAVSVQAGPTPAIAICKAVIAAEWGENIPDEIMEKIRCSEV